MTKKKAQLRCHAEFVSASRYTEDDWIISLHFSDTETPVLQNCCLKPFGWFLDLVDFPTKSRIHLPLHPPCLPAGRCNSAVRSFPFNAFGFDLGRVDLVDPLDKPFWVIMIRIGIRYAGKD